MIMNLGPRVPLFHPQGGGGLILQEVLGDVGVVFPRSTRWKWGGAAKDRMRMVVKDLRDGGSKR